MSRDTIQEEIAAERQRQVDGEGWSAEHDDAHDTGAMLRAAVLYYHHATGTTIPPDSDLYRNAPPPPGWPWSRAWWKPKNPRRDLIRAGALCLAEKARLQRRAADAYVGHIAHKHMLILAAIERLDQETSHA